jgi:hypothetical protein
VYAVPEDHESGPLDRTGGGHMSSTPAQDEHRPDDDDFVPSEELARRQGVKPIKSLDELAQPDLWESDEEYEAFLVDLYASPPRGLP